MSVITEGAGYAYLGGPRVGPVDLRIGPGERLLLSGPSGSGKTTLLRLLAGTCARSGWGTVSGSIAVDGADPATLPPRDRPRRLGLVAQDPKDQLVCGTVADELAFGPECAGFPAAEVEDRIARQATRAGLDQLLVRDPHTLSTGQQQRLVTGAALAGGADVLLLDEPLAHLDPAGADALLAHLEALANGGITVVLAEHRLTRVVPWASRQVELDQGLVVYDGPPRKPVAAEIPRRTPREPGEIRVERRGLTHRYGDHRVLDGADLVLRAGERVALVGENGAGKSTLLGVLSGRLGRDGVGAVEIPQDPDLTLFCATVADELAYGPRDNRLPADEVDRRVAAVAEGLGLTELLDRSPHGLSRGQRLRTAVGAALTGRPAVLLLDEPTAGQDPDAVERVLSAVDRELGDGALLFATHAEDVAARWADRVLRLQDGVLHEDV